MHKRAWFLGICLIVGIICFRNAWQWWVESHYRSLISHADVITALEQHDTGTVTRLAERYHITYQIFRDGKLLQTNNQSLPRPRLLLQPPPAAGVIGMNLQQQLLATRPYELQHSLHHYVFFATTTGTETYVVYGRVL